MEQEIHITLRFNLATGKVGLNEIIYKLKELQDPLMLKILEEILRGYDDLISERLSRTDKYPSTPAKPGRAWAGICGGEIRKSAFVVAVRYENEVIGKITDAFPQYLANWIYG